MGIDGRWVGGLLDQHMQTDSGGGGLGGEEDRLVLRVAGWWGWCV